MNSAEILTRHGLPTEGLEVLPGGTVNHVWSTNAHVIRIGQETNHLREARLARAARRIGIRTPRPVVWEAAYGIWERVAGQTAESLGTVPDPVWIALLDDLDLLHANPLERRRATDPMDWTGRSHLVASTQAQANWTRSERDALRHVLGTRHQLCNPAFVHGDAFGRNVLVSESGEYAALIDWGCAEWTSLEAECARLEDDALELALRRWQSRLDVSLLLSIRLDLFLEVASVSRVSFAAIRRLLDRVMA